MIAAFTVLFVAVAFFGLACDAAWDHNKLGMVLWFIAAMLTGFWGCIGFAIETRNTWKGRDYYRKD